MRRIFWWGVLVGAITLAVLVADIEFEFYVRFWWIDLVEHLLGGVLAGLIGMWWALALGTRATLMHALLGALVLGLLVELVEYMFGFGISQFMGRGVDTFKDTIVDLAGGIVAWQAAKHLV